MAESPQPEKAKRRKRFLAIIGPGILVAATGVGAGDLAIGAFTGNKLGLAVLWAVLIGAALKYLLTEGLARWQLATGDTLLEGAVKNLGKPVSWIFGAYLCVWSFLVGLALMSACGVTAHAMRPIFADPSHDRILYGILHSLFAAILVRAGGFRLFEKVMGVCIGVMFVVVIATVVALKPPVDELVKGLFMPWNSDFSGEGLVWTIALLGGVGGTVTVLCYGYWIREEGRSGKEDLPVCRIDLAMAYIMTAIFGLCMVVIGSQVEVIDGGGASLIATLAKELGGQLGPVAKWAFLVGAWGAIFSSLLGVWQSMPYLFTDFWNLTRSKSQGQERKKVDTKSKPYRGYLFAIATVPALGLWVLDFETSMKFYAVVGAFFIPMLAFVLLILNGKEKLVGVRFRNSKLTTILLVLTLLMFLLAGYLGIENKLF